MIAISAIALFFLAAAIAYVAEHKARILPSGLTSRALQALGFGYVVYHSDSQKHFWALTYKEATEWQACALGDSCVFDNRTKETIAIRLAV